MNPIFAREVIVRWRSPRTFWLLGILVFLLALGAGWIYQSAATRVDYQTVYIPTVSNGRTYMVPDRRPVVESIATRASRTGRELFGLLAMGNALAWLVLCPALTATGVARERERGLLESLQLSPMRPRSQIGARYGAALIFLLVLQLALLPVYGIAYTLGGVSPGEIALAGVVITLTALWGTALGLWFSARAYRPSSALFSALGFVALWSLFSVWMVFAGANSLNSWEYKAMFCLGVIHPWALLTALSDPSKLFPPFMGAPIGFDATGILVVATIFYLIATLFFLFDAARLVNRSLPAAAWQNRNRRIEKWKNALQTRRELLRERRERANMRDAATGALLADLPIEKLVRFKDPLLSREVRGRFRLRRATPLVTLGRFAAFIVGASIWLWGVASLLDVPTRASWALEATMVLWGLGVAVVAVLSSTSFARERESGTWEGLRLSLLSPREMVGAKWASVLISFAYYSAPLWLLLPFGVRWIETGVELAPLALSVLVAISSLGAVCAFGLWMSWRSKNPTSATGWTLGVAFFLLVALLPLERALYVEHHASMILFGVAPDDRYSYVGGYEALRDAEIAAYERRTGEKITNPDRLRFNFSVAGQFSREQLREYERQERRFLNWRGQQQQRAGEFWRNLHALHPLTAFETLSGPRRDRFGEHTPVLGSEEQFKSIALNIGLSSTLILLFGVSLARSVRRERD